jgi:L-seryl-tRNA(Ser) seleniumtransferase
MKTSSNQAFRLLPGVEEVLQAEETRALAARAGRELLAALVTDVLDRWRADIRAGELDAAGVHKRLERGDLVRSLAKRVEREEKAGLVRVLNAAGVVLHTGLGRAPVHAEAAAAMERSARSYGTLEVERFSGRRNRRDDRLAELLCRLTGAEAGIVVNNNAAAVLLLLNTFAARRETVVSRGELVEIGGSFRMPDVMERANTRLVEAGTTNRTRVEDFRAAAGPDTGLFLKVHTSNYRVVGFTEEIDAAGLASLGAELGVTTAFDLGSGLLEPEGCAPLAGVLREPLVREAVKSGVDVVTFSGDKLLGGPQAGLLVGKRPAIDALRRNPMYRALRLDKVTIAGLETTLALYLAGRGDEVPARAMLRRPAGELAPEARALARELDALAGFTADVIDDASQPGSGSSPDVYLPTPVVRVTSAPWSAEELASRLRHGEPPVFARIHEGRLLLDPRTLLPGDAELLLEAFRQLAT